MCIAEKSLTLSLPPLSPTITPTNDAAHYSTKNLKINKPLSTPIPDSARKQLYCVLLKAISYFNVVCHSDTEYIQLLTFLFTYYRK